MIIWSNELGISGNATNALASKFDIASYWKKTVDSPLYEKDIILS